MKNDHIFLAAQRAHEEPDNSPDKPDFLAGKPRGRCPWCGSVFVWINRDYSRKACICRNWDTELSEDENRIRYAAEQLEADEAEEGAFRNATRLQREEF